MTIDLGWLLEDAALIFLMFLPVFAAVAVVFAMKRAEARDERRTPLTDKLIHQPGSQARKRAEDLGDDIIARLTMLFLLGPLCIMVILFPRVQWSRLQFSWTDYLAIAASVSATIWLIRGIVRLRRERKDWLNGMRGEMATAQVLDRLRAHGCEIFHDVPGERGNIDHVVVAPNAVFAVETKWRSKRGQGAASAEVWFDGHALQFPGYSSTSAIEQARACADDLSRFLTGRTGESVRVVPVVALPGWYVKLRASAGSSGTIAINPKMGATLLNQPGSPIPGPQKNRIVSAIAERYPEVDA